MAKKEKSKYKGYIIGGALILCLLIIAVIKLRSQSDVANDNTKKTSDSSVINSAESIEVLPGTSERKSYNKLQEDENIKNVKNAIENGETNLPVLTNKGLDNKNDPFNDLNLNQIKPQTKEEEPVIDTTPPPVPEPVVQATPVQAQPYTEPVQVQSTYNQEERTAQRQRVEAQLAGYLAQWKPGVPFQERDSTGEDLKTVDSGTTGAGNNSAGNINNGNQENNQSGVSIARAGTIIPGVLISALNSDTPGPVLAQIVSGKLKGARLIGTMSSSDSGIVIQFTQLSINGQSKTFSVNAYAIDSNTVSTALASDVNNHYLLRYGLGLAAAFVSGYGEAISNQNTTTTITDSGNVVQTQGSLDNSQIAKSAFGKVGQKLASEIEKDSSKAPTVTVNAGTPIGILIMSDL